MASSSLSYYLNNVPNILSGLAVYYNYNITGACIANNTGDPSLSGSLLYTANNGNLSNSSLSNFWASSGSGLYNNTYSYINTTGAISLNNASYIIIYDKSGVNDGILISTLYTGKDSVYGNYYGGYEFGVTANNYLYFRYYDKNNGLNVYTSKNRMSSKSLVYLSIDNDTASFGSYDYFYRTTSVERSFIDSRFIFSPSGFYIGYNPNGPKIYSNVSPFNGYIDELVVFSPSIGSSYIDIIASGFVNNYSGTITGNYNLSGLFSGVTGASSVLTGFYTEITGYSVVFTGLVTDYFGNQYSGTQVIPLTVSSSGYIDINNTGYSPYATGDIYYQDIYIQDDTYIKTFAKNSINLICPVYSGDNISINLPNQLNLVQNKNFNLNYDYISRSFYSNELTSLPNISTIPVVNGLSQSSGYSSITGSFYLSGINISSDYFITNDSQIYFLNNYDTKKYSSQIISAYGVTGRYDSSLFISNFNLRNVANSFGVYVLPWNAYDYNIFYNGQRLISGIDNTVNISAHYGLTGTGASIYFRTGSIFDYSTGQLFATPKNYKAEITGNSQVFLNINNYADNSSEIYKNGIRLFPDNDYIEISKYDICSGGGIFDIKPYSLYNNSTLFY
jgi:hypothetical protein